MRLGKRFAAGAATLTCVLAAAGPAWAGTIRYDVEQEPSYTIQDNGTGVVKLTFNSCLVAGTDATVRFLTTVNATEGGEADFSILQESGPVVNARFEPPTVTLQRGRETRIPTVLRFSVSAESGSNVDFRAKLDPRSGEGLGQGPGILVRVPCVVPAQQSQVPAPTSASARQSAPCIPSPRRVRIRAGRRVRVPVQVRSSGRRVQGALVRITAPGYSRTQRTNGEGTATFDVRARRAGTLVIQTNVCAGSVRGRVLGAVRAIPRFTG